MVYRECRNTVNHKIVSDEPLGSLTGLAPIRNALFPPFLRADGLKSRFVYEIEGGNLFFT